MPQIIPSKIAGAFSYPQAKEPLKQMVRGIKFHFEREPQNIHDKNAIALYIVPGHEKIKCGYVPRKTAEYLSDKKIIQITKGDQWDTTVIEIE